MNQTLPIKYYHINCIIAYYASQQGLGKKKATHQTIKYLRGNAGLDTSTSDYLQQSESDFSKMETVAEKTVTESRLLHYFHNHIFQHYYHLYLNYLLEVSLNESK